MQIEAYLAGDAMNFSIDELDFKGCGEFERRVLLADFAIPRGRVMTYGGLAAKAGVPGGATRNLTRSVANNAKNNMPLAKPKVFPVMALTSYSLRTLRLLAPRFNHLESPTGKLYFWRNFVM